jgi:hypothetical protein
MKNDNRLYSAKNNIEKTDEPILQKLTFRIIEVSSKNNFLI